jgi:hypothetical protein
MGSSGNGALYQPTKVELEGATDAHWTSGWPVPWASRGYPTPTAPRPPIPTSNPSGARSARNACDTSSSPRKVTCGGRWSRTAGTTTARGSTRASMVSRRLRTVRSLHQVLMQSVGAWNPDLYSVACYTTTVWQPDLRDSPLVSVSASVDNCASWSTLEVSKVVQCAVRRQYPRLEGYRERPPGRCRWVREERENGDLDIRGLRVPIQ